jgi:hypothetical protein
VPPEEVDFDESLQMPIRVVTDDPDAPEYRKVDPDVTHPYRMKEVVEEVNDRIEDHEINRHDIISINNVYDTKERD